jgi:Ca-activated chloride channel family protein
MNASIRLDHSLLSLDGEHDVHAMLELSVPAPADSDARPPLRLALVLDRSGSMTGEKLAVAKRCAAWLVSRLRADDELALVAYDDSVRLLAPLAPVRESELRAAIAGIAPGGSTNLSGGWLRGLEQLRGGRGKILLLTDGLANVGVTDPARLVALARGAGQDGVGTATIGYGSDFDEELLAAMADAGGGNAHWAATPDAAPGIFAAELDGLTRVVAQNVSVEIRPAAAVELVGVLNEYPSVPVAGGVQLELGDGYGGERRRVVFALHVPHLAALGPAKVADVVVRYVSVGDEIAHHELTVPVVANVVSAEEAARAEPDAEVREEVLVLAAARARDEAIKLADSGDYDAARARLAATTKQLRAVGGPVLAAEATALAEALPLLESFDAADRKRLFYESNERKRRRS